MIHLLASLSENIIDHESHEAQALRGQNRQKKDPKPLICTMLQSKR